MCRKYHSGTLFRQTAQGEADREAYQITCITEALPTSSCELTDFGCLCSSEAYIASAGDCVLSNCSNKAALSMNLTLTSPHIVTSMLTTNPATQAWQAKVCQAPIRDLGPMVRQINIALLVVAAVCIIIRFLARWRISGSTIGWDDWTILLSFMLLVPSTVILQISSLPIET